MTASLSLSPSPLSRLSPFAVQLYASRSSYSSTWRALLMTSIDLTEVQGRQVRSSWHEGVLSSSSSLVDGGGANLMLCVGG